MELLWYTFVRPCEHETRGGKILIRIMPSGASPLTIADYMKMQRPHLVSPLRQADGPEICKTGYEIPAFQQNQQAAEAACEKILEDLMEVQEKMGEES